MTIKEFFAGLVSKLRAFMAGPGGAIVKSALTTIISEVGHEVFGVLLTAAKQKAGAMEGITYLTGDQKFSDVSQAVKDAAMKAGVDLSVRALDTIVQLAAQAVVPPK